MAEHHRTDADREHLPSRHDNCKYNRTKLFDCEEDAKLDDREKSVSYIAPKTPSMPYLSTRRRDSGNDVVSKDNWIGTKELQNNRNVTGQDQASRRDADSRYVDSQHHLVGIHVRLAVRLVHLVLPLTREGVRCDVHDQENQTNELRGVLVGTGLAQDREDCDSSGDEQRLQVLRGWIARSLQDLPHDHYRNDL